MLNIKQFKINVQPNNLQKNICDKIIHQIINYKNIDFLSFRDDIYNIFIFQLSTIDCLWYIFESLIKQKHLNEDKIRNILPKIYIFLKFFNNNYRPIYHVENLLFYIIKQIHEF